MSEKREANKGYKYLLSQKQPHAEQQKQSQLKTPFPIHAIPLPSEALPKVPTQATEDLVSVLTQAKA